MLNGNMSPPQQSASLVEIEEQRPGRNKDTTVNYTYINSGEYKRKFDCISNNKKLSRILYKTAKIMLKHRSGTKYEDMYWIDLDSLSIIAKETNAGVEKQIMYSANERVNDNYYKLVVEGYLKKGYNDDEAQTMALLDIQKNFDINFKEVTDDDSI